ncbi:MAG: diacylglycerol kinase [Candidatus Symbiodolus clandestinus]
MSDGLARLETLENHWMQRLLLVGSIRLVLMVEIINNVIETLADRISQPPHSLSMQAKDMGSAAVFLTLLLAVIL